MWASVAGAWESVAKLVNILNPNRDRKDKSGASALHLAAGAGKLRVTELLLDRGWSAALEDANGLTPVFYAAEKGHGELVRLLVERSAELDHRDKEGRTVLHWAVLGGKP